MKLKADHEVEALAGVHLFRTLDRKELGRIAKIAEPTDMRAGDVLCVEGEHGEWAFVLVDAEAKVTLEGATVGVVGPGEVVGELSLLDGGPRAATVTLTADGRVLMIPRAAFLDAIGRSPHLLAAVLSSLGERLRAANLASASG